MLTNDETIVAVERAGSEDDGEGYEQETATPRPAKGMLISGKWWHRKR